GRIVKKLEELGLSDNTILIFTGDNGTDRSITTQTDHGFINGGKGTTTSAGTHVPLIVNWPAKIKKGMVFEDLVEFSDFFPTLADIAGVKSMTDGHSFYPLLIGDNR